MLKIPATRDSSQIGGGDGGDGSESEFLVVVTGGSKGIGRSCVESFARRGARVLFTYCSDTESAARIEQSFQPTGRVQGRHLDQGVFDSVHAFAAEVDRWRAGRPLDALVNNAALGVATVSAYKGLPPRAKDGPDAEGGEPSGFEEARRRAEEDIALMRVNALGPMWVTEALLPMMQPQFTVAKPVDKDGSAVSSPGTEKAAPAAAAETGAASKAAPSLAAASSSGPRKRTVLFVGSVGGGSQSVFPGFRAADAMSKAALAYACKHFAAQSRRPSVAAARVDLRSGTPTTGAAASAGAAQTEASSGGVNFLCLCPGATLTDMFRASTLDKMTSPEELERFVSALPQGRLMLPEEVGEAVQWLCSSPAATMFHGAVIDASAGLAVRPGALTEYAF